MKLYNYLFLALILASVGRLGAQIPRILSFQGVLTDSANTPKPDGQYSVTFSLYEQSGGGSAIWIETQLVDVQRGLISTSLGEQTLFYDSFKFDRPYWLAVRVGVDPEMSPRLPFRSVAYSMSAIRSDTAMYALNAAKPLSVDSARISGTVTNNAITSIKIVDGSILRTDVSPSFKAPFADTADFVRSGALNGPAGGDLAGTYPNPSIANNAVTSSKILNGTIQRSDVAATFTSPYADTADYARATNLSGNASGDLTGSYPSPTIANGAVTSVKILDATIQRSDVQTNFKSPFSDTADYAKSSPPGGLASGDLSGTYPSPAIAPNAITSSKILNGTIQRSDVEVNFASPYADTADYARATNLSGNASGDLTGTYPSPSIANGAVTSAKILDATIQRSDVQSNFKSPFSDTADYARSAPPGGVAGGDLSGTFPNPSVASNAITSGKILDATIQRSDVQSNFKSPFSDTADYAKSAPPGGLAGGDLNGTFPNPSVAANAITSGKILDGTIQRTDVGSSFTSPYADTADYAYAAPPTGTASGDLVGSYPNPSIANSAVTNSKIAAGTLTNNRIATGQIVKSLNGLRDTVFISGAGGATVTTSNDTIIINAGSGGTATGIAGIQNTNNTLDITNPNGPTTTLNVKNSGITDIQLAPSAVTSAKIADGTIQRVDVTAAFKSPYSDTADYAKAALPSGTAGGNLSGTYPNPAIANNAVTSARILDGTIVRADAAGNFKSPYTDTADYAKSAPPGGTAGGELSGTYPNPTIGSNVVTSAKIVDGTIVRSDAAANFKSPFSDTADYARSAPPGGTAGGDLTGTYPNPSLGTSAVTSTKILDATIQRVDVVSGFKAPYADTADYGKSAPPVGTAGGGLSGTYPNPTIANNAVTSARILDGTIVRADVASNFKSPYTDTADYAKSAPPGGSAGGDLTGTYPNPTVANATISSTKILDATIQRVDVVAGFKSPYSDTADFAKAGPPTGTASGDLTGSYPSPIIATSVVTSTKILDATIQRADVVAIFKAPYADTADYAKAALTTGVAGGGLTGTYPNPTIANNAVTSARILDATIVRADAASNFKAPYSDTADYAKSALPGGVAGGGLAGTYPNPTIANNAVTSARILDGTIVRADAASNFKAPYADTADYALGSPPAGVAGGELTGTYPNPTIANNAVTSARILDGSIIRADAASNFKSPYADTADYALGAPPAGVAGGGLTGTYPNPTIANNAVTSARILDGSIIRADAASNFKSPYADTADYALGAPPAGVAGGGLTGTYPNPTIANNAVTSSRIADGTLLRADASPGFKAPFADTADYARAALAVGAAGGDLSGTYPNPSVATNAITTAKILNGAITVPKVAHGHLVKSINGLSDTLTIAGSNGTSVVTSNDTIYINSPAGGGGGSITAVQNTNSTLDIISPNGPTTTINVKTLGIGTGQLADGSVTSAKVLDGTIVRSDAASNFKAPYADTADFAKASVISGSAGGDLTGTYPNPTVATSAITSTKILDGTIQRADAVAGFKAPYADTADYAKKAPPVGTATGDLTGSYPNPTIANNAVTSARILDATIVRADVAANFKSPFADTADYAKAAPPGGSAGGDLTGTYPNPAVATSAITSTKILDGTIQRVDAVAGFKAPYSDTADYAKKAPPVGTATGDLTGVYPNPTIAAAAVTTAKINSTGASSGQAIIYNGSSVTWGTPTSTLSLPFTGTASSTTSSFTVSNTTGSTSDSARAIHGIITSTTSAALASGVRGENKGTGAEGLGVWGSHAGQGIGVYGTSVTGDAINGFSANGTNGVYGRTNKVDGNGIYGYANGGQYAWGVYGNTTNGSGIVGYALTGNGVYGIASDSVIGYAGRFDGRVLITKSLAITGNLSKGGGSFKIDHPLDPANKYLYHSFVESPDMKNIYDGVAVLDKDGKTTVILPDWFDALNRDFRYQLTAIGAPGPNLYIAQEISANEFTIAGGSNGMKVSWQVTGIRKDAYAEHNRIPVEEVKSKDERGRYLYPEAMGLSKDMAIPDLNDKQNKEKIEKLRKDAEHAKAGR